MARFERGKSGNPSGRPRKDKTIRAQLMEHGEAVIASLIDQCKAGNTSACIALLNRITPSLRPITESVRIEQAGESIEANAEAIQTMMMEGRLPAETAMQFLNSLATVQKITELGDLLTRIEALEAKHES